MNRDEVRVEWTMDGAGDGWNNHFSSQRCLCALFRDCVFLIILPTSMYVCPVHLHCNSLCTLSEDPV